MDFQSFCLAAHFLGENDSTTFIFNKKINNMVLKILFIYIFWNEQVSKLYIQGQKYTYTPLDD